MPSKKSRRVRTTVPKSSYRIKNNETSGTRKQDEVRGNTLHSITNRDKYDILFSKSEYSDELPNWAEICSAINWHVISEIFLAKLEGLRSQARISVLDIGCGDGTLISQCLNYYPESLLPTDWWFLDYSQEALEKVKKRALEFFPEESVHKWNTVLGDIESKKTWFAFREANVRFDIALCHGTTVHVDILPNFLENVFRSSSYAIIEFLRGDSRLARLLADDDFVKHGFVYNIWNPKFVENWVKNHTSLEIRRIEETDLSHIYVIGEKIK